eukprot:bmy_03705T0
MQNFWAAPNCTQKSTQLDLAVFRFLQDPARCQKWVENSRRADLEDKTPDQLNKLYRLCAKHFETSMICRTSPYRTEPKHKEINNSNAQNPSAEEGGEEQGKDILPLTLEEKENKEYLKSLFETLILMGKQNIPLDGHEADEIPEVTDNVVDIAGEEHLPVLVRFIDETHNLREESVGFLPYEADAEILAVIFHTMITEKWGNNEERGKELKEICHSQWTGRHDAFEILMDLLQALVLCLDGVNSDTNVRWNNCIAGRAFVLCSVVTDFDFIVIIVVLKNVLSFTRPLGKNLEGQTSDVFFAASSLTAVLHSLNEVMENIEVYHEFWFEEVTNLATKLDIQMKLPGKFRRAQHSNLESQLTPDSYYKETLSVPTVEHIIQELKDNSDADLMGRYAENALWADHNTVYFYKDLCAKALMCSPVASLTAEKTGSAGVKMVPKGGGLKDGEIGYLQREEDIHIYSQGYDPHELEGSGQKCHIPAFSGEFKDSRASFLAAYTI